MAYIALNSNYAIAPNSMLESILSLLVGGTGGAILVWLLRGWITERLKQSIAHEYSAKLQAHKTELDLKVQALRHEYEVNQLRTSLFFDYQRAAFAELLEKISDVNEQWWSQGYEEDIGLSTPVPSDSYHELIRLYHKHQLFLDAECVMAMELLFGCYRESFPYDDGSGGPLHYRDVREAFDNVKYVQPRLTSLFQQKLGIATNAQPMTQLALLGAIRILNRYHFSDICLPVSGDLKLPASSRAAEAVVRADRHRQVLIEKLQQFQKYLNTESFYFHEAEASIGRYLAVLDPLSTRRAI